MIHNRTIRKILKSKSIDNWIFIQTSQYSGIHIITRVYYIMLFDDSLAWHRRMAMAYYYSSYDYQSWFNRGTILDGCTGSRQRGHSGLVCNHCRTQVQQKRWPQGVHAVFLRCSQHREHLANELLLPLGPLPSSKSICIDTIFIECNQYKILGQIRQISCAITELLGLDDAAKRLWAFLYLV